jgi:hypothetical protein
VAVIGRRLVAGRGLSREQSHPEVTYALVSGDVAWRLARVLPATSDRGCAYSALRVGTRPLDIAGQY